MPDKEGGETAGNGNTLSCASENFPETFGVSLASVERVGSSLAAS